MRAWTIGDLTPFLLDPDKTETLESESLSVE